MSRKKGSKSSNAAFRLLQLMKEVPRRNPGSKVKIGTRALTERLSQLGFTVTQRTVQRDLAELHKHFPGLESDGNRDQAGWYWREDSPLHDVPAMTPPMAFAFRIAERVLAPVMPEPLRALAPYLDTARRLLDDGEAGAWVEQVHVIPRTQPLLPARVDPGVLDLVHEALAVRKRLRAHYRPRNGTPAEYELSPLGLVLRHEVAYLVATAWEYDDVRHYALHRFAPEHTELLDQAIHIPPGFDLAQYIRSGDLQYRLSEQPLALRLRMRSSVARHLEETPLAEDQHIEPAGPGWARIEASVADTQQLRWWLLGLGDNVVVEAPVALREEIAGVLRGALEGYGNGAD